MDQRTGSMRDDLQATPPPDEDNPAAIRSDIEETRAGMSDTIDELASRLDPDRLKDNAKEAVRDATIGRAQDAVNSAQERTMEVGNSLMDTVKRNPIPVMLIGLGAGWLYMSSRNQSNDRDGFDYRTTYRGYYGPTSRYYGPGPYGTTERESPSMTSQVQGKAQNLASQASEQAGEFADQAQQFAGQAQEQVGRYADQAQQFAGQAQGSIQNFVNSNPLAAAALALGIGFAVGYAVPETRKEDELMGEAHAAAMDKAQTMAQGAIDKVSDSDTVNQKVNEVAHKVVDKATESAHQAVDS